MLTPAPAAGDSGYYNDSKNYYDQDALGDPTWFGQAAEGMGLRGTIAPVDFDRLMDGRLPDGTVLGRGQGDKREHQSGWDLTFSAPKSVSIMALVGGDKRLIEAVNEAAKEALGWVEENATKCRFSDRGEVTSKLTGNLVAALYPHDLSRAQEPQLHVHSVVMNATKGPTGEWRSLDSRFLYWMAKEGGLRFQESLALKVRKLGYEIVVNTQQGTFELAHLPRSLIDSFSTRSKQVLEALAKRGLTRETASMQQSREAAIESRTRKEKDIDRASLGSTWQQVIREHDIDLKEAGAGNGTISPLNPGVDIVSNMHEKALEATRSAARALTERQFAFTHHRLIDKAALFATGYADRPSIQNAIAVLESDGFLQAREVDEHDRAAGEHIRVQGWTTTEAVAVERNLENTAREARNTIKPLAGMSTAHATLRTLEENQKGWSKEHSTALYRALTSCDRVLSLGGSLDSLADRALTKTYLQTAQRQGFNVEVLAPAAGIASTISHELDRPVTTVASHLSQQWQRKAPQRPRLGAYLGPAFRFIKPPPPPDKIWVVADADHLRPAAAQDLLKSAGHQNARVIFLAEGNQASSSATIGSLRQGGMRHLQLPEPPAQDRNEMHLAVAALQRGEPLVALDHIVSAGGRIVEIGAASRSREDQASALTERRAYIADRYVNLDRASQDATRVVELTDRGRQAMNAEIRARLVEHGQISGPTLTTTVLLPKSLTRTERDQPVSYEPGDIVRFGSRHKQGVGRPAIAPGSYFTVKDVDGPAGKVTLETEKGNSFFWQPQQWGVAAISAYRTGERKFAAGDRVIWTRTDKERGVRAQQQDVIVNVHPETGSIAVERNGEIHNVDVAAFKHVDHAYAGLIRSGGKAEHVIAHMPVDNVALTNVQSLTEAARRASTLTIVTENRERLAQAAEDRPGQPEAASSRAFNDVSGPALDAVRTAADILAERNAVFSHQDLVQEATRQGLGRTIEDERNTAILALQRTGQLIEREAEVLDRQTWTLIPAQGWTTLQATKDEERLLAAELRGRGSFQDSRIMSRDRATLFVSGEVSKAPAGRDWHHQQREAAIQLISSPDRVTALQGLAGSSKTSTVLVTLAKASKQMRHDVKVMAPTTDAARQLGSELGTDQGVTLAQHLADTSRVRAEDREKSPIWIVDEASMASAKDMRKLIRVAEQQDARLFLVMDVLQLSSVGAGRAAGQMIEHGMRTAYLDRILRQGNNHKLRDAIYDMIAERPGRALEKVVASGGTIIEYGEKTGRQRKQGQRQKRLGPSDIMAKAFLERSPDERAKTLVIDPTRKGVASVTKRIREGLKENGDLKGPDHDVQVLEESGLTEKERATSTSYRPGQMVRLGHAERFTSGAVERGSYLEVTEVQGAVVTLKDDRGRTHRWEPRAKSLPVEVYDKQNIDVMIGDKIRWTRNVENLGVVSGRYADIVDVDKQRNRIDIQSGKGPRRIIDLKPQENRHFTHGYAVTTRRAQGATGPVIAHMNSHGVWTVHQASAYTALSRSPDHVTLVTDSLPKLLTALKQRDGQQEAALDQVKDAAGSAAMKVREMAKEGQATLAKESKVAEATPAKGMTQSMQGPVMER